MSGGKGSTTTSSVQIPAEVLARYNSVNANAEQVAQRPFQTYGGEFVAPVNATQQQGIANTTAAATQAQPYYGAATNQLANAQTAYQPYQQAATQQTLNGLASAQPYQQTATNLALGAAGPVNPQALDIGTYLSPYLSTVLGSTAALLNQNNQQQQAGQLGTAIRSGAFGGDRAGIAAANLEQQQNLANANIYSNIANQGFNTALGAAQQQQGVNLSADQANRAALLASSGALQGLGQQGYTQQLGAAQQLAGLGQQGYNIGANTATTLAGLGAGAQAAGLQGAQAQLAAGQVAQQTQQAQDTALYNQFLQQQSYPFQVAQFLANIAEGTGSLSGSTTTTNSVQNGIFSDERLKTDIKPVGKTFDGQTIYSYRYKGSKQTEIGLLAQEVEKKHPEAVGLAGGYKTVRMDKATDDAADRGHFAYGGGVGLGGSSYDPTSTAQLLANFQAMYGPLLSHTGATGIVPQTSVPVQALHPAEAIAPQGLSAADTVNSYAKAAGLIGQLGDKAGLWDYGGKHKADGTKLDDSGDIGYATGGVIPYEQGASGGLDIPDDQKQYKLLTPNNGGGGSGGNGIKDTADTLGSIASAGMTIAKFLPMLSDKRAKEDIRPVGKMFDGQTVYSYKYKGDDTPRMGLIAQEVEKHAPEAIRVARGLKGVDYARATSKAAKRGRFAGGGSPGFTDLAEQANAKTRETFQHENQEADELIDETRQSQHSPSEQHEDGNFATSAAPANNTLDDKSASHAPSSADNGPVVNTGKSGTRATRNNNPGNIEAGSFAKKMPGYMGTDGRFAVFDTPEHGRNAQITLLKSYINSGYDTPSKIANRWAPGSEKGNNPNSYAHALAKAAGIGVDDPISADVLDKIASGQAAMEGWRPAKAAGGRAGYDAGGTPDDTTDDTGQKKRRMTFDEAFADMPAPDATPDVSPALAAASAASAPSPTDMFAPPISVPAAAPAGSATEGVDYLERLPNSVSAPTDVSSAPQHGFFKGLAHGDASSVIPLLAGIGALASTQTNNPLTALAAAAGAGGMSAQQQQEFRLRQSQSQQQLAQNQQQLGIAQGNYGINRSLLPYEQAQTGAQAGLLGANAARILAMTPQEIALLKAQTGLTDTQIQQIIANAREIKALPGTGLFSINKIGTEGHWGPQIEPVTGADKIPGLGGATSTPPPPPPPSQSGGWKPVVDVTPYAPPGVGMSMMYPGGEQRSVADYGQVQQYREQSNKANGLEVTLNNLAQQANNVPASGWTAMGLGSTQRANIAREANSLLAVFGAPPITDTSSLENMAKFTNTLGIDLAHATSGRASGAVISMATNTNPSAENSPMAFKRLVSAAYQAAEYDKLEAAAAEMYYNKYMSLNGFLPAFQKANPPAMFARRAIMNTVDPADAQWIQQRYGDPKARQSFDNKYGSGVSAYFRPRKGKQ